MVLRRILITSIALTTGAFAQMSSFPKPNYFREVLKQTKTTVDLRDPVRLKDFVVDGKLELSLKNYLELVMANNTDVQVTFLSLEQPKNAITSALAGPGGSWDPSVTTTFSASRQTTVTTTPSLADTQAIGSTSQSLSQPFRSTFTQTLDSGTNYSVQFSGSKSWQTGRNGYNPLMSSGMQFQAQQNLLRGRGRYVNRIPVMQARSNFKKAGFNLRNSLLTLVNTAETAYWRAISSRENVKVQESAREASKKNYDFVTQQLNLGAISPLDIFNPEGQLASADLALSQSRFTLAQSEDAIRHQIGADLDSDIRKLPIVLTEPVDISTDNLNLDSEKEVEKALAINPSLKASLQTLDVDDLSIQSANNALLPQLTFTATYAQAGTNGNFLVPGSGAVIPGGLGDAFSQMFGLNNPTYTGAVSLTLPIRNRTASVNLANALVSKKTDSLNLRNAQQNTRLTVLNAVTNLKGVIESLKLAKIQQDLQQKNYDAEVQKYELGTDINQNVVIALQNKVVADSQVVTSQINVRTAILTLLTATGELLDERGIVVN